MRFCGIVSRQLYLSNGEAVSHQPSGIFRGTLLVAGTTIGGGMLALPVLTSLCGFMPSLLLYLLCWFFMCCTGLLLLEVCSWMKEEVNIVTMAKRTLGVSGKSAAWILYLFLFYSLMIAYIVGCGNLLIQLTGNAIPDWLGAVVFTILVAPAIFKGTRFVGKFNILMMLGLAISYIAFFVLGASHVQLELLQRADWGSAYLALPIAFIAFAYQGVIPTLYHDMGCDAQKTRRAIILGSFLSLLFYTVWQWLILGIIPVEGPDGLFAALQNGDNAIAPLKNQLSTPTVYIVGQFFAFFALITSFFGVSLGLLDFLADGLAIQKDFSGRLKLCALLFIPPLAVAIAYPHIFLQALDFAGGFGAALLLGLMPILMVWSGRYRTKLGEKQLLPGGKPLLIGLLLFVGMELYFEFLHHI